MKRALLAGRGITVTPAGRSSPVLSGLEVSVDAREVVGVLGQSGSGKTTLLRVLNGLMPWFAPARIGGAVEIGGEAVNDLDPGQRAHLMGSCLDRPEAQLFLPTVRQELAAARSLYRDGPPDGWFEERLSVGPLLDRRVFELSSGERQRVALAAALSAWGRPVVLDEPTAHLDVSGAEALTATLADTAAAGSAVLLVDHAGWRLGSAVHRWQRLSGGSLSPHGRAEPVAFEAPMHAPGDRVVFSAQGLGVGIAGRRLIEGVDLDVREGEIVVLSGANGVGKSTLSRVLTGCARPLSGRCGPTGKGSAALMMPDADLQLFETTVEGELHASGASFGEIARVLRRHRLDALAARKPWSLSRGERQRLLHAALDVLRPHVMVIDEPAQGLDADDVDEFVALIGRRAAKGRAYIIITHRLELAGAAHRHLRLTSTGLEEVS